MKYLDNMFLFCIDLSIVTMLGIFLTLIVNAVLSIFMPPYDLSFTLCLWFWMTVFCSGTINLSNNYK